MRIMDVIFMNITEPDRLIATGQVMRDTSL